LATTKESRGAKGGRAGTERPKLRSSHEGVLGGGEAKPRAKAGKKKVAVASSGTPREGRAREEHATAAPKNGPTGPRTRKAKATAASAGAGHQATDEARGLATAIASAAIDKKANALTILDVAGKVDYADILVIMTGRSDRHVASLAAGIEEALRKKGVRPIAVEGLPHASWVLMDFGDVVVHVFQEDARGLYDLEGLWMDARKLPVPVPEEMR
jgi:ribosome-associated protein